jgi:hypothetical protein
LIAAPGYPFFGLPVLSVSAPFAPRDEVDLDWRFWTIDTLGVELPGWVWTRALAGTTDLFRDMASPIVPPATPPGLSSSPHWIKPRERDIMQRAMTDPSGPVAGMSGRLCPGSGPLRHHRRSLASHVEV